MLKGIDISKHDGAIDFRKVKESGLADFAILRAGYGKLISQKDVQFERNYAECKKYGIPCGAYWYSYAKSVSEMQTEAKVFLEAIKGKQFEYPVYLDFEEKSQFNLGKSKCCEMAEAFMTVLEKAGYYTGIYCSSYYLNSIFKELVDGRYTVWCAHYGVSKPSYTGTYDIWQYSSTGTVSGINHKCDLNYCYKEDFPEIIKSAGLNGFTKNSNSPEKSVDELAKEVLENKWGTGADRKARLTAAGYSYEAVQNAVNALLKTSAQLVEKPVETVEKSKHRIEILIDGEQKYSGLLDD